MPRAILIVEDNLEAAEALSLLLQVKGYRAQSAQDGAAALALADRFPPDVALIDLALPDIDGFEVGRRLAARFPAAKLILVTGLAGETSDDLGPFHHRLSKPVDLNALFGIVGERTPVS